MQATSMGGHKFENEIDFGHGYIVGLYALCMLICICSYVSFTVQSGASALYIACQRGHVNVMETLLKDGADPNLSTAVWRLDDV